MARFRLRNRFWRVAVVASVALAAPFTMNVSAEAGTATNSCAELVGESIANTTVTKAEVVAESATIPEYCQVDGYVTTPGDRAVPSNRVNVRVGLPVLWNGGFLFLGTGGLAGHLVPLEPGLERGYATATTDTGHQGSTTLHPELDGRWALHNRPKQIDYGYRGTHVATVAAKAVTLAYYGAAPEHSILSGCSNGGRQGFMEAQRFPHDYDGIIADSPAFAATDLLASWIWQQQAQLASPEAWLPPDALPALSAASLAAADRKDGLVDGLIGDPRRARFDPRVLEGEVLSPAQVVTAESIYDGRRGHFPRPAVAGHPVGHEETWQRYITGTVPPRQRPDGTLYFPFSAESPAAYTFLNEFLRYFFFSDPDYDLTDFDLDADFHVIRDFAPILNATNPDLGGFDARGGKMLVVQGWADPAVNARSVIEYHGEVVRELGRKTTDDFFRLFMAPGRGHCAGGPGPDQVDALTAMERWLADDVAPNEIMAESRATGRTRPLCAFPTAAHYRGHGSIDDAENFRCRGHGPR